MKRPKSHESGSAKRKLNKPASNTDEEGLGPKPGLESSMPHIAMMYARRDRHLAQEFTRQLLPSAARCVGVDRRK